MMTSTPPGNSPHYPFKAIPSSSPVFPQDGMVNLDLDADMTNDSGPHSIGSANTSMAMAAAAASSVNGPPPVPDLFDFSSDTAGALASYGATSQLVMGSQQDHTLSLAAVNQNANSMSAMAPGIMAMPESFSNSTLSSGSSSGNGALGCHSLTPASSSQSLQQTPMSLHRSQAGLLTTPIQTPHSSTVGSATPRRLTGTSSAHRRARLTDGSPAAGNNPFYTPPSFLSPKITKHRKQSSISNSVSLTHLDEDLQLQQQLLGSPLTTPLRGGDSLQEPKEEVKSSIAPSLLMKERSIKFGGKLSDLGTNNEREHSAPVMLQRRQPRHQDTDDAQSENQVDPVLQYDSNVEIPQEIMMMISESSQEMGLESIPHGLPRTRSVPSAVGGGVSSLRRRLTRSRSSMNLSDIAASKEAKTAALRSVQSFTISEEPEYGLGHVVIPAPDTPTSGDSRNSSPRRRNSKKGRDRKPTTLVLSEIERAKLDLPQQSARSKSRSKKTTNEKKKIHECPLCHSRFQRPEHVKRHMRSHSSEKPFACPQPNCNKRFNRKDNLKQHLRKIHKLQP